MRRCRGKLILLGFLVGLTLSGYSYAADSYRFTPIVVNGADFTVPTACSEPQNLDRWFSDKVG